MIQHRQNIAAAICIELWWGLDRLMGCEDWFTWSVEVIALIKY